MIKKTSHTSDDSHLIALAKNGKPEAFGELYQRYLDPIYRYIRARVAIERDAEDLTEIVFMRSFEVLDRYEDRGLPYSAFLYRVARSVIADHYRQDPVESMEVIDQFEHLASDFEDTLIHNDHLTELQDALTCLPPDYQEVIRLRLLLDMPVSTVAEWMDRSEGAVRVLLYRALKALRSRLVRETDV